MGGRCKEDELWDALLKRCLPCDIACRQPHVISKCANYCKSALCKAKPGHYYDRLVKTCMKCEDICGRHPAECSQHCPTLLPPVTVQRPAAREPPVLEDSAIVLYSLLALSLVLLFSSLLLALITFLRVRKAKPSTTGSTGGSGHKQKCVVQPGQESGFQNGQAERSSRGLQTSPGSPNYREPSDDLSPTETCACVHCFPDLRALGQDIGRPPRAQYSLYQQAVLHKASTQKGGPVCVAESHYDSGPQVQATAAMG